MVHRRRLSSFEPFDCEFGPKKASVVRSLIADTGQLTATLTMSTEFEEKITRQSSVYRALGQGIKTLHDPHYAEVE
jgi:hypothetical protein